ncbi:MAG: DHH family phosphoesterase [Bacteroidetes bacterium]|nr:MAG: DHH family phosphoesterase [Bacteroidota bacterium]PIE88561.1 MAG: DHH family phosphoesterase [Bacteroidota bacterium]
MTGMQDVERFRELLSQVEKVVLITHLNPDGDALGSTTAMGLFLAQMGKDVQMIIPNAFPGFLSFLSEANRMINAEKEGEKAVKVLNESDLVICLDFNTLKRVGRFEEPLRNAAQRKVLVDHHPEPDEGFELYFHRTSASSASEIVFDLMAALNPDLKSLTKEIATALYVGIMTDTGSFNYGANDPDLYAKVGALVRAGANPEKLHTKVYSTNSESRIRLLGHSLFNRMVVLKKYKTAYIYLMQKDLKRFHYHVGDTEGLVNYTLSIKGINFGVLFTERVGHVKVSLRSKGNFSVNDFARKHFPTGGGHRNAAGAESRMELMDTMQMFEELLPLYIDELNEDC